MSALLALTCAPLTAHCDPSDDALGPASTETVLVSRVIQVPTLVLRRSRGWASLRLSEVWHSRDLLRSLADRDVKLRYRQTALGVSWVVLQPLITTAVLAFAFGRIAKLSSGGVPFLLFVFVGMLIWNNFQLTFVRMSSSLTSAADLVSKVYFPRLILPLATVASALIDFAVGLGILAVLLALYGVAPPVQILMLPVWLTVALLLALGIGLVGSSLQVRYRDVALIIPVVGTFSLFASPVAYAISSVPSGTRTLLWLNPLSGVLEGARWSVLGGAFPPAGWVLYSCAVCFLSALVGALVFRRLERGFADVI